MRWIVDEKSIEICYSLDINVQHELEYLFQIKKIHRKENGLLPKHPNPKMKGAHHKNFLGKPGLLFQVNNAVNQYVCHH